MASTAGENVHSTWARRQLYSIWFLKSAAPQSRHLSHSRALLSAELVYNYTHVERSDAEEPPSCKNSSTMLTLKSPFRHIAKSALLTLRHCFGFCNNERTWRFFRQKSYSRTWGDDKKFTNGEGKTARTQCFPCHRVLCDALMRRVSV